MALDLLEGRNRRPRVYLSEPLRVVRKPSFTRWSLLIGLVAVCHLVVLLWGISRYPGPFDDEGTYLSQAWAVINSGQLSHYTYWYDHPPLGWLLLVPWMWATDAFHSADPLLHGRVFMALIAVGAGQLVYITGRRLGMRRPFALIALLLFAFSPLAIHYHRMVLLDNLGVPFLLIALSLVASPKRRLWEQLGGVSAFAIAILIKETLLLLLPAMLVLLWQGTDKENRRYVLALAGSIFTSMLLMYPIFAALRGELLPGEGHVSLVDAVGWQLFGRDGGGSLFDPTSQTRALVSSWLEIDRLLPILGLSTALPSIFIRPLRPLAVAVAMMVSGVARPGYVPVMFIVGALPLFSLAAAGIINVAWQGAIGRHQNEPPRLLVPFRRLATSALVIMIVILVGPAWASALRVPLTEDLWQAHRAARAWLVENVDPGARLLVDNTLWLDLVTNGFPVETTVWFYKLDLDPSVADQFPSGWSEFDYLVSTPLLRVTMSDLPTIQDAHVNSVVIYDAGGGVEVRSIVNTTGS